MATIANLAVSLTARIGSFQKGFARARKTVMRFAGDLARHTLNIVKFGAAMAAVAVGGLLALARGQADIIDSISKTSRVLGLSTEELAGYGHAIDLAGGDQEGFNKAIIRMNRTIADAESGLSTANRELERAGLNVEQLAGLSTDERIKLLADRYNSIGDAADRASFLMNIFGRQGKAVGTLFEQGAAGIEAAQKEAEKLHLTFNDLDGRQVEEANDAMTRLRSLITGIARRVAIQLAPYIQMAADKLRAMGMAGEGMGMIVVNAFNWIMKAVGKVADMIELVKAGWFAFEAAISGTTGILLRFAKLATNAFRPFTRFFPELENAFTTLDDMIGEFESNAFDSAQKASEAFNNFLEGKNSKGMEVLFEKLQEKAKQIQSNLASSTGKFDDIMDEAVDKSDKTSNFQQVESFKRLAIGGAFPKDQPVTRKQGETQIGLLQRIAQNTGKSMAVIS